MIKDQIVNIIKLILMAVLSVICLLCEASKERQIEYNYY
jgi:hypothetical protein